MKVAVVIPIYKSLRADLKWYERISLDRCIKVLGHHQIIFVAPEGRDFDYLPSNVDCKVEPFDARYFSGRMGYNLLMLDPKFYGRFFDYDYILLYQLDAFVFSDRLSEFCELDYDYIGAPWILGSGKHSRDTLIVADKCFSVVGNGGFCLRRPRACAEVLSKHIETVRAMHVTEDFIFAYLGQTYPQEFKLAPVVTAGRFSFEHLPERYCRKNGNVLPFGCHGWHKNSADFYVRVFEECGYDIAPYKEQMLNVDLIGKKVILLQELAKRLRTRMREGLPLMRYLPSNEPFYVFTLNDKAAPIVQRLYDEGLPIINVDNIPFLDSDEQIKAVAEVLSLIDARGLLIGIDDRSEEVLSKLIKVGGLKYGKDFISLWRESVRWSAAALRRIARPTVNRKKTGRE